MPENAAPRFRLLYFKNIVDFAVTRFFDERGDEFRRTARGYVYCGDGDSFERRLAASVRAKILEHVRGFDILRPEYHFIIGDCEPRRNVMLKFVDEGFPPAARKLVWADRNVKYFLKERDLLVDEDRLNSFADRAFDAFFAGKDPALSGYRNVVFIRHSALDSYAMFKTLKFLLGKGQCSNVFEEEFAEKRQCLASLNEIIDGHVNNKAAVNRDREYRLAVGEIREFVSQKLSERTE